MYLICFYVPEDHLDAVKNAMFAAGAGKIGKYSHCCWQVLGQGQFMPLEQSQPFIGQTNQVEQVAEYKVEIVCEEQVLKNTIAALLNSHPYETPAYQVIRTEKVVASDQSSSI